MERIQIFIISDWRIVKVLVKVFVMVIYLKKKHENSKSSVLLKNASIIQNKIIDYRNFDGIIDINTIIFHLHFRKQYIKLHITRLTN